MKGQTKYSIVIQNMNHAIKIKQHSHPLHIYGGLVTAISSTIKIQMLKSSYKTIMSMCVYTYLPLYHFVLFKT